jgi:phage protein D
MSMLAPNYVPDFSLSLNGSAIPATMRACISSVRWETGLQGADQVEITLANGDLRWLDEPLLALDTSFVLQIGYQPGPLDQAFVGQIVSKSATFPSNSGPTVSVTAQDRRYQMQQGTKVRWFAIPIPSIGNLPLPDLASAALVSLENLLIPNFDPIGAALAILLGGVEMVAAISDADAAQKVIRKQQDESDYAFLDRVARENGWNMFVEHTGPLGGHMLSFQSPLSHLSADLTLQYGLSLIDFTPRISTVGQIASVSAFIWIPPIKTTLTVTIGWDWDRMALTLMIYPGAVPLAEPPDSQFQVDEPVTPFSAPRKLIGELIPKLNQRLTGKGSCVGDTRVRAGAVIQFEGLGEEFGGRYRVTSATHTLDDSGFRTSFDVQKEIWFGSIPSPQQGASPVRLSF